MLVGTVESVPVPPQFNEFSLYSMFLVVYALAKYTAVLLLLHGIHSFGEYCDVLYETIRVNEGPVPTLTA